MAAVLETLREDLTTFYSLGFEPPAEELVTSHRVEVRLRPPYRKLETRYRREIRYRTPDEEAAQTTLSTLLFGAVENPLGARVILGGEPVAEGKSLRLPVSIEVPLSTLALITEPRAHSGRLSIFVTSGDLDIGAAPVRKAVVPFRIANEEMLTVSGRVLEYSLQLEVEPSACSLAVGIRDDFAPLLSTVRLLLGSGGRGAAATPVPPESSH